MSLNNTLSCVLLASFASLPGPAADAEDREPVPDRLVVLTFDDAVKSHFTVARPILKRYGFGATFFISEGFHFATDKVNYMTWEEIRALHDDGFEIGNHTGDHMGVTARTVGRLGAQLAAIDRACEAAGIPRPVSFAYPGNAIVPEALPVLRAHGIRFARRGGAPEFPYEAGRGVAYEPGQDHPLLIPTAGDARPAWTLDDFRAAVEQAGDGRIAVLQFHGVPEGEHPWVNTPRERFEQYMKYLHDGGFRVVAMRDLARFVDPDDAPADPWAVIRRRSGRREREEEPGRTTLANPAIRYTVPESPYVVLRRGDVEAVVVDHRAVDDAVLPGHRAGYSGLAALRHASRRENLFVPAYAGLNFEHIHDGTTQPREILFEPRHAPVELRRVDDHTAELYQRPTPHWGLESCTRYELLPDGAIEMTLECIPRRWAFRNGYIGLFWASYIHRPESGAIHFRGHPEGGEPAPRWIEAVSPAHGEQATHLAADDRRDFPHVADFPLTLVFHRADDRYDEPWYFGISHGLAYAQVFRPRDRVRLSQSPSGGGAGNPAWDFQHFIPDYRVGRRYTLVMRALYLPYESPEQVRRAVEPHQLALERDVEGE